MIRIGFRGILCCAENKGPQNRFGNCFEVRGSFDKGAAQCWGPKRDPNIENYPLHVCMLI